ncbi:MAG: tRNA lysidine(34) synthetase TilS [Rhodothermales bacterium]|nr:tRNA lysidine(34) synthetase TilS [Rhodothermales bacterium]
MKDDGAASGAHPLESAVRNVLHRHGVSVSSTFVVGVSGGVDSMTLLQILVRLGIDVVAVHVNYGLRGAESDKDEDVVREVCERLDVPLKVRHLNAVDRAKQSDTSMQDAARQLRYESFKQTAEECGSSVVCVAHNRDDQAETVVMHLARGTGIDGAAGMAFRRPAGEGSSIEVLRPLLFSSRQEIVDYADALKLHWREDQSNLSANYTRSRVRSELRPAFDVALGHSAWEGVASSAELIRQYVEQASLDLAASVLRGASTHQRFSVSVLLDMPTVVRDRILLECLRAWLPNVTRSRAVVKEVAALLHLQPGSEKRFSDMRIVRDRDWLIFAQDKAQLEYELVLQIGQSVRLPIGIIRLDELRGATPEYDTGTPDSMLFDLDETWPLTVRPWREGDRMRAFGNVGTQKISDLLTNEQVSVVDKPHTPVVVSGDGTIIWAVGVRSSEDGKVMAKTGRVGLLSLFRDHPE